MNPYMQITFEMGPKAIAGIFAAIPEEKRDLRNDPERFTPREVLAHLADFEPIFGGRIRTALEASGTNVPDCDEGKMAIEHNYAAAEPDEQLRIYAAARAETATLLRDMPPELWSNTVIHPYKGEMTVEDQANFLLCHDMYHVEQLAAYLKD